MHRSVRFSSVCLSLVACVSACKTVVTTSTEVRPSRYAAVEFASAVARDSVVALVSRALVAENVQVQRADRQAGSVTAGPVTFAAAPGEPALDALVTIAIQPQGDQTRIRILASAVIEAGQTGGQDARLLQLVQRIQRRFQTLD